jgi:hypothetical protein
MTDMLTSASSGQTEFGTTGYTPLPSEDAMGGPLNPVISPNPASTTSWFGRNKRSVLQGTILASGLTEGLGAFQQGRAVSSADQYAASAGMTQGLAAQADFRRAALESEAASQRDAIESGRQGGLVTSRLQSLAAASGAGATDPTVIGLRADLEARTDYEKKVALYEGSSRAAAFRHAGDLALYRAQENAKLRRFEANQARSAGVLKALSAVGSTASLLSKYG